MEDVSKLVVLTGVKPTGTVHIGNYIGALKSMVDFSRKVKKCFLFIADYHSLNQIHDAATLRRESLEAAALYIALGYDYQSQYLYRQSDIPEVFELTTIISAVTPKGLMNRAHAYKAAIDANREKNAPADEIDAGVNMGLYTYPILMAADILAVDADIVPVGQDQFQHVEFARDIAGHFNNYYGPVIKLPRAFAREESKMIPGLDGRKMSKSYGNTIPLMDDPKNTEKLIMRIVTDSKAPAEPKDPEESTIYSLYRNFATEADAADMREAFLKGGMGYGDAKKLLAAAVNKTLEEVRGRYNDLMARPADVYDILASGAAKARETTRPLLARIRESVGV